MKKIILVCCILFWFGCKKETENSTQVKINKDDYLVEKIQVDDWYYKEYFYDSLNRIKTIKYSNLSDSSNKSTIEYTYDNNTVFINDNQPRLCYLNKNGLIDSFYMKVLNNSKDDPNLIKSTRVYYIYGADDMLIEQKSNFVYDYKGSISILDGTHYYYENQNKNVVLTNEVSSNYKWTTNYIYYQDKKNDLFEFDKLMRFVKSSYNLVKTETSSSNSIITYYYKFNELGLVSEITKDFGTRLEVSKIFWRKK